ncbi:MAG TPA: FG-GAP-like repeat-containing protein, partial [Kofleriaceae bacterium]|nr:FG-GAP-like repeat-containing protein [Kofleriaceae bacterium]
TNEQPLDMIITSMLLDLNGDGLPDFVSRRKPSGGSSYSAPVNVAWNDGTSMRLKRFSDGVRGETDLSSNLSSLGRQRTAGTYDPGNNPPTNKPSSPGRFLEGDRYTMERFLDLDGDGRVDLLSAGNAVSNAPTVAFNLGGEFKAPIALPGTAFGPLQRVRVNAAIAPEPSKWATRADFLDLDGDGLLEYYNSTSNTAGAATGYRYNPAGKPPRLLHTVRNGYGATTTVVYSSMQDAATVVQGGGTVSPKAQWVVKSVTNTDDFTQTGSAAAYSATTSYKYIGPRYLADDEGRYGFRGFNEVQAYAPTGAASVSRYQYNIDWSGRLVATLTVPAATLATGISATTPVSSVATTDYQAFSSFNGALVTYHPVVSRNYVCSNGQTEDTCSKSGTPAAFTKTVTTMVPAKIGAITMSSSSGGQQLGWVAASARLQALETAGDGDRVTLNEFMLVADASNYRLRPTRTQKIGYSNGNAVALADTTMGWDPSYKQMLTTSVKLDGTGAVATTTMTYDSNTGNVTFIKKPVQTAGAGPSKKLQYDANKLFVIKETNELNHIVDYEWEPGTGSKLATIGPNDRTCTTCPITATSRPREEHRIVVDAAGRTVAVKETQSDQGDIYTLYTVAQSTYNNPDLVASPKVPAGVLQESLLEIGGATWVKGRSESDGHGRPLRTISYVQGTAPVDAISTYTFASDGKRNTVTMPDPTQNSSATVTYVYDFDSLGRATRLYRPDTTPLDQNRIGATMRYDGVYTFTEEVVGANELPAQKIAVADTFGRLVELRERSHFEPEVSNADVYQTTHYTYALDDTMAMIEDPEGVKTMLTHDMAGRRTMIERAGRQWKYTYDANGNVLTEQVPGSTGPLTDAQYTTTMSYDALDRIATKMLAPRTMTPADVALFGAFKSTYTWDYGAQRKGRLRYTQAYGAAGATTAVVATDMQYDAWGNNTFMNHIFNGAGFTNLQRQVGARYAPGGKPMTIYYRDYVGGANETQGRVYYDARG